MRQNLAKQMTFTGIIPARYASTRFPGKPLAVLGGKPVIQRVYEQVASVLDEAYVATDDERIFNTVEAFGGRAIMTRTDHKAAPIVLKKLPRNYRPMPMSSSMYRAMSHLSRNHSWKQSSIFSTIHKPRLPHLENLSRAWML